MRLPCRKEGQWLKQKSELEGGPDGREASCDVSILSDMWRIERKRMRATQDHTCFLVLKEET